MFKNVQNFNSKILNDFVHNQCSEREMEKIRHWLVQNQESEQFHDVLYTLWNETQDIEDAAKSKTAYKKFCQNLKYYSSQINDDHRNKNRMGSIFDWVQKIAAVLIIPVLAVTYYFYIQSEKPKSWIEDSVAYGQKKEIILPDKSSISLNAGSKVIYPAKFNNQIRQVFVSGEAYLDVTHDASRPFYLSTGNVNIRVWGTKFNVKSYPEESKTEVSLIEGRISLDVEYNGILKHYQMTPGTCMSFNQFTGEMEVFHFSVNEYSSWSENNGLYFRHLPLEDIMHSLERRFNVKIVIRSESLKNEKYFASFVNNESLPEILKALNINNEMRYVIQRDVVDIYAATK